MLSCKTVLLKIKSLSKSSIFVDSFFKKIHNEIKYCSANGWYFKMIKKNSYINSPPICKIERNVATLSNVRIAK